MSTTDLVHSTHQVAYERPSAAEEALTTAMPLRPAATGPVNLTWNQPATDLWPHD